MRNVHSTGSAHVIHQVILQLGLSDLLGSLCLFRGRAVMLDNTFSASVSLYGFKPLEGKD